MAFGNELELRNDSKLWMSFKIAYYITHFHACLVFNETDGMLLLLILTLFTSFALSPSMLFLVPTVAALSI